MKKLICGLLVATTLTGMAMPVSAEDITVRGAPTCRAYLAAREKGKHGDTGEALSNLVWFLGYMSGLAVGTQVNVLEKDNNAASLINWLDVYCPRYPDKYLSDAGDLLHKYFKEQNGFEKRT
jgi:hypothetical protein